MGDFHIKIQLKNKEDGFEWVLIATYGAAQEDLKEAYLTELVQFCSLEVKPLLIRGDFNIIRKPSEKNNDRYNAKWPFLFNACIEPRFERVGFFWTSIHMGELFRISNF